MEGGEVRNSNSWILYFGQVGSLWGHSAFFVSSWGKKVITPLFLMVLVLCC